MRDETKACRRCGRPWGTCQHEALREERAFQLLLASAGNISTLKAMQHGDAVAAVTIVDNLHDALDKEAS